MSENRKPCAECPFSRACKPGTTGGSSPTTFVGQAYGPFLLACHMTPAYKRDKRAADNVQCAGAAAFRANVGRDKLMPLQMVRMPADTDLVFADGAELIAHHEKISIEQARELLAAVGGPEKLMRIEFAKAGVQLLPMDKITDGKKKEEKRGEDQATQP